MGIYARVGVLILKNSRILHSFSISTFSIKTFLQQNQVSHSSTQNNEPVSPHGPGPKTTTVSHVAELHDLPENTEVTSRTELRLDPDTELHPIRFYESRELAPVGTHQSTRKETAETAAHIDLEQASPVANRTSQAVLSGDTGITPYSEIAASRRSENKAAWSYTKVAFLMYIALLIVWVSHISFDLGMASLY